MCLTGLRKFSQLLMLSQRDCAAAIHRLPPQQKIPHVLENMLLFFGVISFISLLSSLPRRGELRTQKLKSHLVRAQSLNFLPLKPGVGQYIAIHATHTARDFFLTYFYPSGPFNCIFSNLSRFFPVFAVADTGSCVGLQNKIGQPAGCRFPC